MDAIVFFSRSEVIAAVQPSTIGVLRESNEAEIPSLFSKFGYGPSEIVYRLSAAKRRSPPMLWLRGHNHTSTIGHINTAEHDLGRALLDFVLNPREAIDRLFALERRYAPNPLQAATPLLDHTFEERARSSAMVARVEICSGSVQSSISAGRPAARARSNAGANSSLRITRSA